MRAIAAILAVGGVLALASGASALEGVGGYFGSSYRGALGGQLDAPAGVAVNERTGDVYVADSANNRVEEFSASGAFIRAWGHLVGGILNTKNEIQPHSTEFCEAVALCAAAFASAEAGGMSDPQGVAVSQATGDVYVSDENNLRVDEFSGAGQFIRAWGAGIVASGPDRAIQDAQQTVSVDASGGMFTLTFGGDTTVPAIAYDAPATGVDSVQKALEGLASIAAGNVSVGGPDGGPYTITFRGALANTDVPTMTADGSGLTGSGAGVSVATVTVGDGAAEVCTPADACQAGVSASSGGAFASTFDGYLAVAPAGAPDAGDVIVADPGNARVQEFSATGEFVRAFGGDVNRTAGEEPGASVGERDLCAVVSGDLCQAGTPGTEVGRFAAGQPTRVAVDSSGAIYTVESSAGFRVQKLTPADGGLAPSVFAAPSLIGGEAADGPSDVAVDPATNEVYVVKGYPEGAGEPPALLAERRLLVLSPAGALQETGLRDEAIGSVNGLAVDPGDGRLYVSSGTLGQRVYILEDLPAPAAPPFSRCPNEALREESNLDPATSEPYSMELPDCRAYEQVTPSDTNGYRVFAELAVSEDGSRVIARSLGIFAGGEVGPFFGNIYQFDRTPSGWAATPLDPPASQFSNKEYYDESPVTGATLWELHPTSEALFRQRDIYLRAPDGTFSEVGPMLPPGPSEVPASIAIAAASRDFSHVFFEAQANETFADIWPFDTTDQGKQEGLSLYEYTGTGNTEPELVGVQGGRGSDMLLSRCGIKLGSQAGNVYNAVSASGETVFFTASATGCEPDEPAEPEQLYARISRAKTLDLSEPVLPAGGSCTGVCAQYRNEEGGHHRLPGVFDGASEDGSKVFFETEQPLLNGDEDEGNDLYMAEIEGAGQSAAISRLVQVSHDPNAVQSAEVQGVARISEDGSHVYFVAKGVLTGEANGLGQTAELGEDNLYVYDTGAQRTSFVATLAVSDSHDWTAVGSAVGSGVQATPDGGFLVFPSFADLTADAPDGTLQLYRYDASTGALQRVSIGQQGTYECPATKKPQDGFNCDGATGEMHITALEGASGGKEFRTIGGRAISTDGSYVFFTSTDALTPRAQNTVMNVYEWEADGAGACRLLTGCVSLLSDGHDASEEAGEPLVGFMGADASGADAFLQTSDALSPSDTNLALGVYDARLGGGFPAPAQPASCLGEGCQPAEGSPAPAQPAVDSQAFTDAGALAPAPIASAAPVEPKATAASARAKELARALRACQARKRSKRRRRGCEAAARKRYGSKPNTRAKQAKADRGAGR
jgi:DNA-binding beta-propeller fold protein YncE